MGQRKIRVLQFPIGNSNGGITHYARGLWNWIDKGRFQFDFATTSPLLDFEEELLETGAGVYYVGCRAEDDKSQFVGKISKILENGYDVIHLHTAWWKSFQVEKLAMRYNVPRVIVHSHNTDVNVSDEAARTRELAAHYAMRDEISTKYATDFWACSTEAANWLFGKNVPKDSIRIMKNAIDTEKFCYSGEARVRLRQTLGIEGRFAVGCVAQLIYQKNIEFLLRAFALAYQKNPGLVLLLAGDGELREELEKTAADLGLAGAVRFLGKRADVRDIYQAFDLFVLPSRFEGLPIVLIEAQTAGLRCLAADTISREAKITGLLEYLPLSEEIWAGRILEMAAQPCERRDMRTEIAAAGYDIRSQIKVIEDGYSAGLRMG